MSIKRHIKPIIILLLFFCCNNFLWAVEDEEDKEKTPNFLISEIFYYFRDKDGKNDKSGEWIEVYNKNDIELNSLGKSGNKYKFGLRFCDRGEKEKCKDDHPIYYKKEELNLNEGEIFIIARDDDFFKENYKDYNGKVLQSSFDLSSSKNPNFVGIFFENDDKESWLDEVEYEKDWGGNSNGKSIERKRYDEKNKKDNWTQSVLPGGTPGEEYKKNKIEYSNDLVINEIFPNPKEDESKNEFIEIKNLSDKAVNLMGWKIEDKSGKEYILDDEEIDSKGLFLIKRTESKISLNNDEEKIIFYNPNGEKVDEIFYRDALEELSWSRDDKGNFSWTRIITPGKENEFPEPEVYSNKIIINEILPNPKGSDSENEWIELFNKSNKDIDLKDWFLADNSGKRFYFKNEKIKAEDFLVISSKISKISLNNGGDKIFLFNPNGEEVDVLEYKKVFGEDVSFACRNRTNFLWTSILTPGRKNEFLEDIVFPKGVYVNEIMSNPKGVDDGNEWVEFFNESKNEIDLSDWILENSSGKNFVIKNFTIQPGEYKVLELKNTSFYIKNSQEKLSFLNPKRELIEKIDLDEKSFNDVSYNKTLNRDWRWSRFITPGEKNKINNLPKIKIKKEDDFYVGIYGDFNASNTKDRNGDKLKFKWDFGDGHKSYKKTTRHRYDKKGKYLIKLVVFDGSEEISKELKIEVKDYPRREVEIVELMPNPVGTDSKREYLILKNNSSKKLNLKDWKIATGKNKEKLVSHPIYENFVIESGKEKKIKRDKSRFSLLNKKGVVALKYPDGEIADLVKYEKEEILENERYILIDNKWAWIGRGEFVDDFQESDYSDSNFQIERGNEEVSFQKVIAGIFSNDKLKITQELNQLKFDNWVKRNETWLKLGGLILFLKRV